MNRLGAAALITATLLAAYQVTYGQQSCPDEARSQADALYEKSLDTFTVDRTKDTMFRAIKDLEKAKRLCPSHERAWALLCELYWYYGDMLPQATDDDKKARISWFQKGIAAGDRAIALNPTNAQALFFKTCNMAGEADMKGWAKSLWMFPTLKANTEAVERIEPHYLYGACARFWCEVLSRVPLWLAPKFGYSVDDVLIAIEGEIRREPRYFSNYVYAARLYWKINKRDRALSYLERVITGDPQSLPEQAGVNRMDQRTARKMWKEFTGKEYPER